MMDWDNGNLFSFEDLKVWKKAVIFAEKIIQTIDEINTPRKHYRLIEQLESAGTSVAMNIAEGKGRQTTKEFIQFLYIARGSLNAYTDVAQIADSVHPTDTSRVLFQCIQHVFFGISDPKMLNCATTV